MFILIKELFHLLTAEQRKAFFKLQALVVVMAFAEIFAISSIVPFMTLVGDISILDKENLISQLYDYSGFSSRTDFTAFLGVTVLLMLGISALISTTTIWRLSMFATKLGSEIADELFVFYMKQNWMFHASTSSSQLTKKITNESSRVTSQILIPIMQVNARLIFSIFLIAAIFIYDPTVAVSGLFIFSIAYFVLFKFVRGRLQNNGKIISQVFEQRFRLMNESFGGIKDILLLGRAEDFIKRFNQSGRLLASSQGGNTALAQVPRYFMELVAFGSIITLVIYLLINQDGNLNVILPILSLYALAGFKLLPAFQQIYSGVATVKGNISAFETIKNDLYDAKQQQKPFDKSGLDPQSCLPLTNKIELHNLFFTYPGKQSPAVNNLNLTIPAYTVTGVVGHSGSGKSTLVDILLGLISAQSGQLSVDGQLICAGNRRKWQNSIGFVPQNIFLSEGTIAENVAYGISEQHINLKQVNKALCLAHLDEFVSRLEDGIQTKVGERGVQLSGGQRQRIGIARALYNDPDVLVFDEATSALDGITEKMIMDAIHDFSGMKTIILIAHRLKTVQKCDQIILLEEGVIVDKGTYSELIQNNPSFKKMAEHA